jgi:hypothetical protein
MVRAGASLSVLFFQSPSVSLNNRLKPLRFYAPTLTYHAFFMLPLVVQVKDDDTKEGKEQMNEELDENEKRKQRNTEVGGQPACCPKLLLNRATYLPRLEKRRM